nr:MAG TPA: hypothetical protein [Caudoviricetes sp.]
MHRTATVPAWPPSLSHNIRDIYISAFRYHRIPL